SLSGQPFSMAVASQKCREIKISRTLFKLLGKLQTHSFVLSGFSLESLIDPEGLPKGTGSSSTAARCFAKRKPSWLASRLPAHDGKIGPSRGARRSPPAE